MRIIVTIKAGHPLEDGLIENSDYICPWHYLNACLWLLVSPAAGMDHAIAVLVNDIEPCPPPSFGQQGVRLFPVHRFSFIRIATIN